MAAGKVSVTAHTRAGVPVTAHSRTPPGSKPAAAAAPATSPAAAAASPVPAAPAPVAPAVPQPPPAQPKTASTVTNVKPSDHFTPKDPPTATVGVRKNPPAQESESVAADADASVPLTQNSPTGFTPFFNVY